MGPDALRERLGDGSGPELWHARTHHPGPDTVPATSSWVASSGTWSPGLIGGLIVYVVVVGAAGQPPALSNPLESVLLFLFVMLTLAAVGVVFAAFYVYTRYAGFIQNIGEFAFYVGTGCMFPVVLLPFWTNPVALVFPPTWALDALRYVAIPGYVGFGWGVWVDLAGALATTAAYLAFAGWIFRRVEHQVLEKGNLGDY